MNVCPLNKSQNFLITFVATKRCTHISLYIGRQKLFLLKIYYLSSERFVLTNVYGKTILSPPPPPPPFFAEIN